MAVNYFKYAYTQIQLSEILSWAINMVVADDLARFDIRPKLSLQYLFEDQGLGHEAGFEIDAYPLDKNEPVQFYIVQGDIFGCAEDGRDVAIYTPEEIRKSVYLELLMQQEKEPRYAVLVEKMVRMFNLSDIRIP